MFAVTLRRADETRRYLIARRPFGWEVTSERQGQAIQHINYDDWHRVERKLELFRREVSELMARGWREVSL